MLIKYVVLNNYYWIFKRDVFKAECNGRLTTVTLLRYK